MKYEPLSGALEEEALRYSYKQFWNNEYRTARDMIKDKYGFMGYAHGRHAGTLTASAIQLEVRDGSGTSYCRTYTPEQWLERARDAAQGHQIDLFELMGAEGDV